ncbi:L,D-transpeptidase family protein [Psychrobacter sp.]|uniref:L,D-transpeptidase family protein n=1 Tax=Psychrobacter sp. TaxID=56811 RepID=UPI0025FD81D4|nr:L,D-transpeptidase family protein [Psychrobacter sp.]
MPKQILIISVIMMPLALSACSSSNSDKAGINIESIKHLKDKILQIITPEPEDAIENESQAPTEPVKQLRPNISQQFIGDTPSQLRLAKALPELPYETTNLPEKAQQVNQAVWTADAPLDENVILKIQALLNYNHHSVGAIDGRLGKNAIKAIQVFQEKQGLEVTGKIDDATWKLLTADSTISAQPVLVNYTLTDDDVTLINNPKGQQFKSVLEAMGEKFHMSKALLLKLNPNTKFEAGNKIVVYNPYQPNEIPVHRVVAVKSKNLLYAYDENNELVASYPTTMGSSYKPSPNGQYKVVSRIIDPTYNKDFKNHKSVLPPGPNNPVGRVWLGLSKRSYGIHGSPEPERISRQNSSGCVRLTNWDALGLYGTIEDGAKVEFL